MTVRSIIDSVGVALPARVLSTQEVVDGCVHRIGMPFEKITGIRSRHVAAAGEFSADLSAGAARDCLARSAITPADIDLLICTSISRHDAPDRVTYEPGAAARLRHVLGCTQAWAFDVTNACAGKFTGLYIADALIRSGRVRAALVVSGEYITHLMRTAQKEITADIDPRVACLTLGDAGTAVLLTRSDDETGFEHIALRTIGRHHALCVAGPTDAPHGGAIMKTDMLALTVIAVREAVAHAQATLGILGHAYGDVDRTIPHQSSWTTIEAIIRQTNRVFAAPALSERNVINNLARRGNTASTTHMLALRDASLDGRIRSGDRVLFGVAASGINVGTAVYRLDDLPARLAAGTASVRTAPPPVRARTAWPALRTVAVAGTGLVQPAGAPATTMEMIGQATRDCLRDAGRHASDVELLIHAGVYRTGFIAEPAIAAIAAGEFGFDGATASSGNVLAFDLGNGGLGLLDACRVACSLISAREVGNAIVVASEAEERECGIGAARVARCGSALFLEADPSAQRGFLGFHSRQVGDGMDPFSAWAEQRGGCSFIRGADRTLLYDRYVAHLPRVVSELLEAIGVAHESIRRVVLPWLPEPVVGRVQRSWPVLGDRVVVPHPANADLFTSALPFGLRRVQTEGLVATGDLVILTAAASGAQVGAALYRV